MPHAIYSGYGEYDSTTFMAVYKAYLPKLLKGEYEFNTGTIYNVSCEEYPNTILLFMKVKNDVNIDLATTSTDGNTEEAATTIMFSVDKDFVVDINENCMPLDYDADLQLILFHDEYYDTDYISENLFCKAPGMYQIPPEAEDEGLEAAVGVVPKKGKQGILSIIKH